MPYLPLTSRIRVSSFVSLLASIAVSGCSNSQPDTGGVNTAGSNGTVGGVSAGGASAGGPTAGGMSSSGASSSGASVGGATSGASNAGSATGGTQASGGGAGGGMGGSASGGSANGGSASGGGSGGHAGGGVGGAGTAGAGTGGASPGTGVFHIFMLMGQSNMVGVADKQDSDKNTDTRLKVWGGCKQTAGQWNTANPPLNDCPGESGINLSTSVDPGIWFAKTLLKKLPAGDTVGLVGTAESGEKIETFLTGGSHHQMILTKIAAVKTAQNAHFEGVIFHQGESNNGQSTWPSLVVQLYNEVKAAFGVNYDVPFILGELPAGGCCSGHNTLVHKAAGMLPMGAYVPQDGTNVLDQYHFDHASVVLMGTRYGDKMIDMLKW